MFSKKLLDYIGDISQIGGIKRYVFCSGKSKGVEAFDVNNGSGLVYTVIADRGLDIYNLSFRGIPVSFISKVGITSPCFYNERNYEWLRSFTGGFLTTCGLTQVGDPCIYENNEYGLHGIYSNLPADDISVTSDWCGDIYVMEIYGKVRQAKVQFENLLLKRSIKTRLGIDRIILEDTIVNEGDRKEPFMILYHMNFGYPFLNPDSGMAIPSRTISGWDDFSAKNLYRYMEITEPDSDSPELTYYHDLYCDKEGFTKFMIYNKKDSPDIGVSVKYNKNILNNLTQWKCFRKNDYLMALEPCNNLVKGVNYEDRNGTLKFIQPGETVKVRLEINFFKSKSEIEAERNSIMEFARRKDV